jgi:uncharacterized protein
MLLETIQQDILTSLKRGDAVRVDTLRFLLAAIKNSGIDKYGSEMEKKLNDADVLEVVKKQVKSHKDSIDIFSKANRMELVDREQKQLAILEQMLPAELSDAELMTILTPIAKTNEPNFGILMGLALKAVNGKANGGRISTILRQLIQK